jgi:hypothetical protein
VCRRNTGAGQFKGRDRVGGEMGLFDAEGGSNISGTEVFAMIIGLILTAAFTMKEPCAGYSPPSAWGVARSQRF